jgi:hypothetical protein
VNGAYSIGEGAKEALSSDVAARYFVGLALDYPPTSGLLLLLESYLIQQSDDQPPTVNAMAGLRWRMSPRWILDLGAGRSLTAEGNHLVGVLGLTANPGAIAP